MSRVRPLRLDRLWILPAIYGVVTLAMVIEFPPHGLAWAFCALALAAGAALGWQRGRMMRIAIDPATQALNQSSSPAAMLLIVAIVVARQGARAGGAFLHIDAMALTDMLMALALGLFTAQRIEMYLRAKRMLAAR